MAITKGSAVNAFDLTSSRSHGPCRSRAGDCGQGWKRKRGKRRRLDWVVLQALAVRTYARSIVAAGRGKRELDLDAYVIEGCGYDSSLGMVTVVVYTPVAAAWTGRMPDANGCISVSNFSTQGAGRYRADAWQHVRNRDVVVATTAFDA